jgi:hypothetical protein
MRQLRAFTSSAAMYEHAARFTVQLDYRASQDLC